VLVSVKSGQHGTQRELADAVGIEPATLTHHLHRMEADGLVRRARGPQNRRVQTVELAEAGEAAFGRLFEVVAAFDAQLRGGMTAAEVTALSRLLGRLRTNAARQSTEEVSS